MTDNIERNENGLSEIQMRKGMVYKCRMYLAYFITLLFVCVCFYTYVVTIISKLHFIIKIYFYNSHGKKNENQ